MKLFESKNRIDFEENQNDSDHRFSIDYLFGKARGQMFGVLECESEEGEIIFLKAFSGQYNSVWEVDGWVPPLFSAKDFDDLIIEDDKKIKSIGKKIELLPSESEERKKLIAKRKKISQDLLKEIYSLYRVENFRGQIKSLFEVFPGKGIPTGTGDCCAPKLLCYAAKKKLKPLSLAEFFWGKENLSGTKKHGRFYPACAEKCQPILGFILCGIDDL